MKEVTYEQAKKAAQEIREHQEKGISIIGANWVWPTFEWECVLQDWRQQCFNQGIENEFEQEYQKVHDAARYNWHRYEEKEY